MANSFSPIPRFNASVKYLDPNTPSGLTTAGFQQFAQLQAYQGVAPVVTEAPTQPAKNGAFVFNPNTNTLHVYNEPQDTWRSVQLT